MKFNLTIQQLKYSEKSVYSQGGQDGVLEAIFNQLGIKQGQFFDIGARDGKEISNTANLWLNHDWGGLRVDAEPLSAIVVKDLITRDNINDSKYRFGKYELFNLDIDGNEYWVWEAMKDTPSVVVIEYNSKFRNDESYAIEYNPEHKWEGDDYYGASLLALKKLGDRKGYTLVYVVDRYDAVFIRNDLVSSDYVVPTLDELLPEPIIAHETKSTKRWVII